MFKFLFLTLWNIFVSAVVCLVIIKLLLHSAVQKEFDNFKENLEKEIQAISCTNKDFMIWYNDINLLNEVNADTAKRIS